MISRPSATTNSITSSLSLAELTKQAKYQYLSCNFKYIGKGTSNDRLQAV